MTIIIGMRHATGCVLGTDSQITWGSVKILGSRKLMELSRFVLAVAGPSKLSTILELGRGRLDNLTKPHLLAKSIQSLIAKDGWRPDGTEGPNNMEMSILVADKRTGDLYWIDGTCSLERIAEDSFICAGSGDEIGTGAMAALDRLPPEKRVRRAIQLVCRHNTECGGEVVVRSFG